VVYDGPGGPWSQRKFRKKSRLKKNFKPISTHEGVELENQNELQSCSQKYSLQLDMVFFRLRPKKFPTFFLPLTFYRAHKILSMPLKIWSCVSGYPEGLSIFWDYSRFSWPLGKIHFPKRVWNNRQISIHVRPCPPLGPTFKETSNFYRDSGHVSATQMGRPTAYKKPLRGNYLRFGEKLVLWDPETNIIFNFTVFY
jgi:hypothetical protein